MRMVLTFPIALLCYTSAMNGARAEGPAQIAGKPEAQSPIAMIAVRYQAMQRMYVSFKIQTTFSLGRDPATVEQAVPLDGGMVVDTLVGTQIGKGSFSFLNGMARYEMHWQPLPSQKKRGQAEWTDVESYGTERIENLTNVHDNRWEGAIDKTGKLPSFMDSSSTNIDIALGLRLCTSNEWLTNGALKEMNVSLPDPEHVVLSNTPKGSSHTCHYSFEKKLGYALTSLCIKNREGHVERCVECSDFREVENLMLPFKISILDTEWVKEQPHDDQKAVIDVENYKLQEKENSAARYRLAFPKGSTVFDVRTDQVFRLDKESELDDDTISRAIDTKIKQGQMDRQEAQMLIDSVLATQPATQPAPAEHP